MIKPSDSYNKLDARAQVAIQLKVPDSGVPWIDDMIVKANSPAATPEPQPAPEPPEGTTERPDPVPAKPKKAPAKKKEVTAKIAP